MLNCFVGEKLDQETGLYYYGARYLDPRTSRWLSGDPALGDYIPQASIDEEAKKHNEKLPGQGGVFNYVNLHVYHYAANNPVKYVDPDGEENMPSWGGYIAGQYEKHMWRGLSLPALSFGNAINSVKNFFKNIGRGEGETSVQLNASFANSAINVSLNVSGNGVTKGINTNILSQLEAVVKSPIRTQQDESGNLTGVEFHIPVTNVEGIGKVSAILAGNFDTKTGDARVEIGAKLSEIGFSRMTSVSMKLMMKASTIGDHPTAQGGNFADNFKDEESKRRYKKTWESD